MLTIFVIKRISLEALQNRLGPKEYRCYPRISLYRISLYRESTVVKKGKVDIVISRFCCSISAINLRMMFLSLVLFVAAVALAAPRAIEKRSVSGNAAVNLNVNTGTPQHLASGFIYGIPDNANQIPSSFYSEIDFGYGRAGGAQVASPGLGWIWGLAEYKVRGSSFLKLSDVCLETSQNTKTYFQVRFASALSNYKTVCQHGGKFVFLIHDLWGADGTQNSSAPYPGDNGDWTSWDNYLTQWISDMNANGATADIIVDIWNEPDGTSFWNRSQAQWIQMWGRTYYRLR
jgi:hypothetical protein